MAKITYLMGAGASVGCLPIYKNFRERFSAFCDFMEQQLTSEELNEGEKEDLNNLIKGFSEMKDEFRFHSTPDTVAKKFFHSHDSGRLVTLKDALILFFLYEQTLDITKLDLNGAETKEPIDKRYDAFIAALLKPIPNKLELLEGIHILSWNYDLQFEISFSRYKKASIPNIQHNIQSFPLIDGNLDSVFDLKKFSIVHLNGIAYGRPDNRPGPYDNVGLFTAADTNKAKYLLNVLDSIHTTPTIHEVGGSKLLSFAWENINEDYSIKKNDLIEKSFAIAMQTEILVINGYSFPIFNRAIDLEILKRMRNLKFVYLQSPTASEIEKILKEIFASLSSRSPSIINLGYWNQFFIPDWLVKPRPRPSIHIAN